METLVLSYSWINDYLNCPWKTYRTRVKKDIKQKFESDAQSFGNKVHTGFENAIKNKTDLPTELSRFQGPLDALRTVKNAEIIGEQRLAASSGGDPADWYGTSTAYRGKVDALIVREPSAVLIDWKTGSKREDSLELEIQACLVHINYPNVKYITGRYVWFKENKVGQSHNLDYLKRWQWLTNIRNEILEREEWPKRPNALCAYCPVGDCEWNKKRKT